MEVIDEKDNLDKRIKVIESDIIHVKIWIIIFMSVFLLYSVIMLYMTVKPWGF